jgi:hypothetical protein
MEKSSQDIAAQCDAVARQAAVDKMRKEPSASLPTSFKKTKTRSFLWE